MFNYLTSNLDSIIISTTISLIVILIYHLLINTKKIYFYINQIKVTIQNKDSWSDSSTITNDTKSIELSLIIELYNHQKDYNSLRKIKVIKRKRLKYSNIENFYLNLTDKSKTLSGSTTYEKLKYINLLPNEAKLFNCKITLTKDEFVNIKKEPIYISYKEGLKTKKIKLNKYLRRKK